MHIATRAQGRSWLLATTLAAGMALAACGGGDDAGPADAGEPCNTVGQTQTNCVCSHEQPPGTRKCRDDFTWSKCECRPPVTPECEKPGDTVQCAPCPGETVGHETPCLQGNTFDCGCD
jgi:hypothetical protein